jgi:hypothetical protein
MSVYSTCNNLSGVSSRQEVAEMFHAMLNKGKFQAFLCRITGRNNCLMSESEVLQGKTVGSRSFMGLRTVRIDQIIASESRCQDFDRSFHPLNLKNKDRWVSVATAFTVGIALPAIDLVKVGDTYLVRDGHHRISVSKALGIDFIEASIHEWVPA